MKNLFFIATAAALLCSCSNKPKYDIEGSIAGLEGTVYMFRADSLSTPLDSATVKSGKFSFKGPAEKPATVLLSDSRQGPSPSFFMQVFLEPGMITVANDPKDSTKYYADGTPANAAAKAYMMTAQALMGEYKDAQTTDERRAAIEQEFDGLTAKTVAANPDNLFGVSLLPELAYQLSGQEMLDQIAKFSPEMQAMPQIAKLKATAQQKLKTAVGAKYIEIVQQDSTGTAIPLSSVVANPKNKYVLVDFWASWCGPCMGEVPYLKTVYAQYHPKGFEIYGVSFDRDRDKWVGTVQAQQMNWIHVSDVNYFDNQAARDYAVEAIPTNVLIATADSTIVARNLRGEDLGAKIEELLGK